MDEKYGLAINFFHSGEKWSDNMASFSGIQMFSDAKSMPVSRNDLNYPLTSEPFKGITEPQYDFFNTNVFGKSKKGTRLSS